MEISPELIGFAGLAAGFQLVKLLDGLLGLKAVLLQGIGIHLPDIGKGVQKVGDALGLRGVKFDNAHNSFLSGAASRPHIILKITQQ